jgi:parallel beta-helix repeat protein
MQEARQATMYHPPMIDRRGGMVLGALTLACAVPSAAGAATYYVSPTGSDTNPCSITLPCREIRRPLTFVVPGDTILAADGSYKGFDVDNIHGTAIAPITIRAQGSAAQILVTTDRPDNRDTIFITFSSHIVVDGLRASGANRAAVRVDQSPRIAVRNGVFGNNTTWGIFTDFSDDLLLENNECFGSIEEHGIYVSNSGDRPVVRGNRVHDNNASGIQLNADAFAGGDGIISNALIENNVIYGNGDLGGAAINLDGVQDSVVRNNVLYDNHATGIVNYRGDGAQGPRGMRILHNTVDQASDARWALLMFNTTGPNVVRNNILYNRHAFRGGITYETPQDVANTDSDYNIMDRVTPDDGNTIYTLAQWQALGHEPHSLSVPLASLWVNPAAGDYHLAAASPAIDAGQTLPDVTVDIEGNPRPAGPASDIGAYEKTVPATLSTSDCSVTEGDAGQVTCTFTVSLSAASSATITVAYATADGTAVSGQDYVAATGTLTFTPGTTVRTVPVAVIGDLLDEPTETFVLNLSAPVNATIADGQGTGTILDDDPAPAVSIGDCAVVEGDAGSVPCTFTVVLSAPSSFTASVAYATANGTATAGSDYTAASGTVTFSPGSSSQPVVVQVLGDLVPEADETFTVILSGPSNATLGDAIGAGTIGDDDSVSLSSHELHHGSVQHADLLVRPDLYRIGQKPYSSYEVVIDAASGDMVPAALERLAGNNATVLQTAIPVSVGGSLSLRWENTTALTVVNQHIRVDGACAGGCGSDDAYRIRAFETTFSVPRFNNAGSQVTVLLLQNPAAYTVTGTIWFWNTSGTLLGTRPLSLATKQTLVLNTTTVAGVAGQGGTITVSHDGRYGDLTGKTVALEPSTGFSFDSPMSARPR